MIREIEGSVVVITGASSGIGHATAVSFACRGARLVLGARARTPLESTADECRAFGASVLALSTDVRKEEEVDRLASDTVRRFGRLDTWVNAAAVMAYGSF